MRISWTQALPTVLALLTMACGGVASHVGTDTGSSGLTRTRTPDASRTWNAHLWEWVEPLN